MALVVERRRRIMATWVRICLVAGFLFHLLLALRLEEPLLDALELDGTLDHSQAVRGRLEHDPETWNRC